ncbi:MAG: glycoside hydrolase family 43 protein [Eubacteriales bacterium]|nr:glycoside hydrolase family 43 protein [Eubacteriales bacterium]
MEKKTALLRNVSNPVLRGFHPDPSLIRVGADYYLATSTFEWFPGVRIYHSKNLADWEYLCAPLDTYQKADLRGVPASDGIWAPCLSHDGTYFYLIYTVVHCAREFPPMDTPNYLIYAKDLTGPWSEPIYLNSSGFDPSLFHDRDGRKWLVNMEWDYRKAMGGHPFTGILLQEYSIEEKKLIGKPKRIFTGTAIGSTEGPHLYWHDGYYYLMCAEGGTSWFHAVTVARSRNIDGPYETHPGNPVVSSWEGSFDRTKMEQEMAVRGLGNSYLKKAGHGSLCEGADGNWYLAHLCARPLTGMPFCPLGRETAIQEIVWNDGWPVLKSGRQTPEAAFTIPGEDCPQTGECREYRFLDEEFRKDFQTLRIPYEAAGMTIRERKGYLRIYGKESIFSTFYQALLARRQTELSFRAGTKFEFQPESYQQSAGLIYRYDEKNQYYAYVSFDEESGKTVVSLMAVRGGKTEILAMEPLEGPSFELEVVVEEEDVQFFFVCESGKRALGPKLEAHILSDDYTLGFTGAFVGMCVQDLRQQSAYADFEFFRYETLKLH